MSQHTGSQESSPHISAVLIVRDEEDNLVDCLTALDGVVDEIVVVDTGSTDRTVEIAETLTERTFHFAWVDDFAAARNFALQQARGNWVLSIDADEVVADSASAGAALRAFAEGAGEHILGLVEIENITGLGETRQTTVDHTARFFPRDAFRFVGAIHEQLVPLSGAAQARPTGIRLLHSGYAQASDDPAHKAWRNIPILEQEIAGWPEDEYLHYQLGKAFFSLNRFPPAVHALQNALDRITFEGATPPRGCQGAVARVVLTDLLTTLAYALVNRDRLADAQRLLETHAALGHAGTQRADFQHALGYVYLVQGAWAPARAAYEASLAFADREDVLGTGSFRSHYHLGLIAEAEQDLPGAWEHYAAALRQAPADPVALSRVIDLAAEQGQSLPAGVLSAVDDTAFEAAYLEKIRVHLENGAMPLVNALIHGAADLSPALLQRCREALKTFLKNDDAS